MFPLKTILPGLLCCLFSVTLFAQTPALSTTAEEVIVTGAKFAQSRDDSPLNVTVIDSATVAQNTDLAQLLNEQPGISINGAYSNPGKDKSIFLRNGANNFTVILLDGQPLLDPSSLGGAVDLRLLSLDGIDRIEILRGARSLLYGSDAVAGVINLISKGAAADPSAPREPSMYLRAAAQNYGTFEGGLGAAGGDENIDFQINFDYFSTRGISEAVAPAGTSTPFERDGATRQSTTASLNFHPLAGLSIRPSVRLAAFDGDYDAGSFQDADNTYTNDLLAPALAVDYLKNNVSLGGRYGLVRSERVFNSTFGTSEFAGTNQQADVFGTFTAGEHTFLTGGLQYRDETLDNGDALTDNPDATTISPYLQAGTRLAKVILLEAGFRFNNHSRFGGQANYSLALSANATDALGFRVSAASAYQSPTLDQLFGPFGPNAMLQPQVSNSVEIGTTLRDPDGSYSVDINAFRRTIKEVIQFDFALGYQNRDQLLDNGVEVAASARISDRLSLAGNVSYVKGRLSSPDGNGGTTESDKFFRRPRTTGMLGLTFNARAPFTARLTGHYTGDRPDVFFDAGFERLEVDLDPYFLLNAYAEYRLLKRENLRLFLDAKNITNADFVEVTGFGVLGTTVRFGASIRL